MNRNRLLVLGLIASLSLTGCGKEEINKVNAKTKPNSTVDSVEKKETKQPLPIHKESYEKTHIRFNVADGVLHGNQPVEIHLVNFSDQTAEVAILMYKGDKLVNTKIVYSIPGDGTQIEELDTKKGKGSYYLQVHVQRGMYSAEFQYKGIIVE